MSTSQKKRQIGCCPTCLIGVRQNEAPRFWAAAEAKLNELRKKKEKEAFVKTPDALAEIASLVGLFTAIIGEVAVLPPPVDRGGKCKTCEEKKDPRDLLKIDGYVNVRNSPTEEWKVRRYAGKHDGKHWVFPAGQCSHTAEGICGYEWWWMEDDVIIKD